MYESGLLVLAELGLSLYPQLIKLIDINLESQVVIRFITYTILGLLGCAFTSSHGILEFSLLNILY